MPRLRTNQRCQTCGWAINRWIHQNGRRMGHADGLDLFCSPTCAMTFAVAAYLGGVRMHPKRKLRIRELNDPLIALSLHGATTQVAPTPESEIEQQRREFITGDDNE